MSTSNKNNAASLDSLPRELIIHISDYCDLHSMEILSFACRFTNEHIRISLLDLPPSGSGFVVLQSEATTILDRVIKRLENESSASIMGASENPTEPLGVWGHKACGAFFSRYAKDERIILAKEISDRESDASDHQHWKIRRAMDILVQDGTNDVPHYLYYWDNRDGPNWEGWWITPHSIGFTRYWAFSRGNEAQEPHQCHEWNSPTIIVRKEPFGRGVLVRDTQTTWDTIRPFEGFYKQMDSTHSHGNRRVYQRKRGFVLRERLLLKTICFLNG